MIKKLVFVSLTCLLFLGFKSPSEKASEKILKDYWLLDKVTYLEPNMYDKTILFNDVTNRCFEQSLWRFSPNSNSGSYAINDLYCSYGKREITFDVTKNTNKSSLYDVVLNIKNDAGEIGRHKLKIKQLSSKSMQWHYTTQVNNKPYTIKMKFVKKTF
ncbi:MAG: hypothetical protein ACPG6B_07520 [Oceanihabitans sp.]